MTRFDQGHDSGVVAGGSGQEVEQKDRHRLGSGYHVGTVDDLIASEKLCAALAIPAGARVLDLAFSAGCTAVAAARRHARVTALSASEHASELAQARAALEGLDIDWVLGDPTATPFEDGSFDYVLSIFGVAFIRDQASVARELARLVRRGGTVVLTAFVRQAIPSRIYDLFRQSFPSFEAPPNAHYEWTDAQHLATLLAPHFGSITIERDHYDMCNISPMAQADHLLNNHAAVRPMLTAGNEGPVARYKEGVLSILAEHNRATDGTLLANVDYGIITAR